MFSDQFLPSLHESPSVTFKGAVNATLGAASCRMQPDLAELSRLVDGRMSVQPIRLARETELRSCPLQGRAYRPHSKRRGTPSLLRLGEKMSTEEGDSFTAARRKLQSDRLDPQSQRSILGISTAGGESGEPALAPVSPPASTFTRWSSTTRCTTIRIPIRRGFILARLH